MPIFGETLSFDPLKVRSGQFRIMLDEPISPLPGIFISCYTAIFETNWPASPGIQLLHQGDLQMFTTRRNTVLSALLFLLIMGLAFSTATAQTIYEEYEEGIVTFDYDEWPWGGMSGTFLADGPVWGEDLSFPEGQDNGCGGGISGAMTDTTKAIAIGAVDNPNGTRDVTVVFITFPEGPATGSYAVDTETMSAGFVWIDDVENLTMPEEGDDYQVWFDNLVANHKFGSTSGTINVTAVGANSFSGTFSGMMGDPDDYTLLEIENGQFEVLNVAMAPVPQAKAPARLAAAPNPFNPQTTVYSTRVNTSGYGTEWITAGCPRVVAYISAVPMARAGALPPNWCLFLRQCLVNCVFLFSLFLFREKGDSF